MKSVSLTENLRYETSAHTETCPRNSSKMLATAKGHQNPQLTWQQKF
jgi:hypothetical protein